MHVIVSGTASGIGLAIAKKFLDAGHSVTGFDLCRSAIDHPPALWRRQTPSR